MAAPRKQIQAAVIGDSRAKPAVLALAEETGALLAELDIACLTGGRGGIMEAASRGAHEKGGLTISIIPGTEMDGAHEWSRIVIPTGMGHARNALMGIAGDFAIVIGGGAGTLTELSFAWIHGRPILTLAHTGGWADRLGRGDLKPDTRESSTITHCANIAELREAVRVLIENLQPGSQP